MNNPFTKLSPHEIEADHVLGDSARRELREIGEHIGLSGSDLEHFVEDHYAKSRATIANHIKNGTLEVANAVRERCRQIMEHSAAADRPELAKYLALETDTPAAEAIKQLSTAPAEPDAAAKFILEAGR